MVHWYVKPYTKYTKELKDLGEPISWNIILKN